MNGAVTSYATVLLTLPNASDAVADAQQTFQNCPLLTDSLSNPTISEAEKFAVIDRIFPESLRTFLKVVCQNGQIDSILEIFSAKTLCSCRAGICNAADRRTADSDEKNDLCKNRRTGGTVGTAPESGTAGRLYPAYRR